MAIERESPRMSLSKLGEYMTAHAGRRRTIVADQKRPKTYIVTWYSEARTALVDYFTKHQNPARLEDVIDSLIGREFESEHKTIDARNSAAAIEAFLDLRPEIDFGDVEFHARDRAPKLSVAGVDISVSPDVLIEGSRRNGNLFCGAMKIYIIKDNPLDEEAGACSAAVLKKWVDSFLETPDRTASGQHCIVLDIFARRIHRAPLSAKRRLDQVEAACEEIALRWRTI